MIESLPQIIGLALGLLIAIPMGIHMFRECFSNYRRFKDELKQAQGSEEEKLYDGEFTKAVNHQFIEFKTIFALVFPILVFLLTYSLISSIAESAIQLYAGD
ncbi:hypothetical protein ACMXYO_05790 [Neptuniibacter sp. QD37_6]|uniref:hypothetical protein n=1 Tax=Neptuniibacter sp. QD37_6 TaxID=3398210 RepID=UPI0039F4EE0E